jgi:hypothetical protein
MQQARFYQQIFAYAAGGYERINDLQIAAVSRDLPGPVSRELRGHVDRYSRPMNMRPGEGPEAFRYARLSDGWSAVTYFQDKGIIHGRDGCFLAHSLVFQEASLQANGFNIFPLFDRPEIRGDYVDGQTDLPELLINVPPYEATDAKRALESIDPMFGLWDDVLRPLLLVSHPSCIRPPKILLTRGNGTELLGLLSLVFALSPPPARPGLTFTTYTSRPNDTNLRFVGNPYLAQIESYSSQNGWLVFGGQHLPKLDLSGYSNEAKSYADKVLHAIDINDWNSILGPESAGRPRLAAPPPVADLPVVIGREDTRPPEPLPPPASTPVMSEKGISIGKRPSKHVHEAERCADLFRLFASSNQQPSDIGFWREGPAAAVAMLAGRAADGPAKTAEMLLRAAISFGATGAEAPEHLRSLLRQFAGTGSGEVVLRQCLEVLSKKARERLAREFEERDPEGLFASLTLVLGWQGQVGGENREALNEVERRLRHLGKSLAEKTESAAPKPDERPSVSRVAAFRKRIDPTLAALLFGLFSICLTLWTIQRTGDLARRVAQLEKNSNNNTRQASKQAAPPADSANPPPNSLPNPSAAAPQFRGNTPLSSTPAPAPASASLAEDREKVRQCVMDLIGHSPDNGFQVSDRERLAASSVAQKDEILLELWAHFYVAARNEGEAVNLGPFSLDKVKSDPIYPLLTSIVARQEKPSKLLPRIAELPCPRRGP